MNGFFLIDKPPGPSSFAAVRTVRRAAGAEKAGHAGTLDPAASGLLIIAINDATRLLPFLPTEPKTYEFTLHFGARTDTLDDTGTVVEQGLPVPTVQAVEAVLPTFTGEQRQRPPAFSAVKIDGVRAYKRARSGEEFEPVEKTVRIDRLGLLGYDGPAGTARCEVVCSTGTYIRSLSRDIAVRLGTAGYASAIRRTSSGRFTVAEATPLSSVGPGIEGLLIGITTALNAIPAVEMTGEQLHRLSNGREIEIPDAPGESLFAIKDNRVLALLERRAGPSFHPLKVLSSAYENLSNTR